MVWVTRQAGVREGLKISYWRNSYILWSWICKTCADWLDWDGWECDYVDRVVFGSVRKRLGNRIIWRRWCIGVKQPSGYRRMRSCLWAYENMWPTTWFNWEQSLVSWEQDVVYLTTNALCPLDGK